MMLSARRFPLALAFPPHAVPPDAVQSAMSDIDKLSERLGPHAHELLSIIALSAGFRILRRIMGPCPRRRPVARRSGRMRPGVWGFR